MHITLTPMRFSHPLKAARKGDSLILNDEVVDFSDLKPGETMPMEKLGTFWIVSDVTRDKKGTLALTMIVPHSADAPKETLDPAPLKVSKDGPLDLPPFGAAK